MRLMPLGAPKLEAERVVGEVVPSRRSGGIGVERQCNGDTGAAGPGFRCEHAPTRATSTIWRSWSSVHFVPGWLDWT
jgi:hypothetical protein